MEVTLEGVPEPGVPLTGIDGCLASEWKYINVWRTALFIEVSRYWGKQLGRVRGER